MKKTSKRLMAAAAAVVMAAQFAAFNASADDTQLYLYGGYYYENYNDAVLASNSNLGSIQPVSKSTLSLAGVTTLWAANGVVYSTKAEAESHGLASEAYAAGSVGHVSSSVTGNTTYRWFSLLTGKYYSTYADALLASGSNSDLVLDRGNGYYDSSYTGWWYSSYTGKVYSSYSDAVKASGGNSAYVSRYGTYYGNYDGQASTIYRYYYNGVPYGTLEDAQRAGGTALGVDIFYSPIGSTGSTTYYYYYNNKYYGSLSAAQAAGGTALGVDISLVPYNYYYNSYYDGVYYGAPYGNYYYGYGMYGDPFYTYNQLFANKNNSSSSSSSSKKEAEDGEPYISGHKTRAGWDTISTYIKNAKSGANINVVMNGGTLVSADALSALKGKNVSLTCTLDNGVKWVINGKNVTEAKDIDLYTKYNIQYIPASLVKKASKDAVSKAQIGITQSFDALGTKANVSVKFSTSRAGCTAVAYRYDPLTNTLKGVSRSKVQDNGRCTIAITEGGPYLIVLK